MGKRKAGLPNIMGYSKSGLNGKGSGGSRAFNVILSITGTIFAILLVIFVLTGGINQRKFLEGVYELSQKIGINLGNKVSTDNIEINEDGVYIKP